MELKGKGEIQAHFPLQFPLSLTIPVLDCSDRETGALFTGQWERVRQKAHEKALSIRNGYHGHSSHKNFSQWTLHGCHYCNFHLIAKHNFCCMDIFKNLKILSNL